MSPNRVALRPAAAERPLNRTQIKYIAILLMLFDHVAAMFVQPGTAYYFMRTLGRITAPVMAFFIAEGYRHTRDVRKYLLRLAIFALISAVPFRLFESGTAKPFEILEGSATARNACALYFSGADRTLVLYKGGVITTLFLGLLAIVIWDRSEMDGLFKLVLTFLICWVAGFYDWSCWGVLYCLGFYFAGENRTVKWSLFTAVTLLYVFNIKPFGLEFNFTPSFQAMRLGTFLVIPLLDFGYNGRGGRKSGFNRWFFYAFYPAHLLALYLIGRLIQI